MENRLGELTPQDLSSLLGQIGNTPVREILVRIDDKERKIQLKLEGSNPAGSVKDRTALGLIEDLENRGLNRDSILLESTSGNLGVSIALIAKAKGLGFRAVVDPKTTVENIRRMEALGAEIDLVAEPKPRAGLLPQK